MSKTNVIQGFFVPSQNPLDPKSISKSENILKNLGTDENLAFTYYDGLIVFCAQEDSYWKWREGAVDEIGLMEDNFQYPSGHIVNGFNYSMKYYNFFKIPEKLEKGNYIGTAETLKTDIETRVVKVAGSSLVPDAEILKLAGLDPTSDINKPVSTAQQAAIDTAVDAQITNSTALADPTIPIVELGNVHILGVGPGTYANWGGMVIPANNIGTLQRVGGVYSVSLTPVDLSFKADISYVDSENNKIQKTIIPVNGYLSTPDNTVIDFTTPTLNTGWRFATEECKEGDVFNVAGFVFSTGIPVYAFLNADNKVISRCSVAGSDFLDTIIAPYNAVRIVHNSVADYTNYLIKSGNLLSKVSEQVLTVEKKNKDYTDGVILEIGYISAGIGSVVDWENPAVDSGWMNASLPCIEGDCFEVKGYSFSGGIPVYAFLNSSDIAIKVSSEVDVLNNTIIVAPVNAVRVVFTSQTGYSAYLKKITTAVGKLAIKLETNVVEMNASLSTYIEGMDAIVKTDGLDTLKNNHSSDTTDWGWLTVFSTYIGYNEIAENDALLKTARIMRFNSTYSTLDTLDAEFVVGIIDQRKNLIPSRTYTLTGVRDGVFAGVNQFEYIKFTFEPDMFIKKGEVCFIKVNSISPTTTAETIAINSATYDAGNKLLYTRELVSSLTEVVGKGAMEFVIETLPYNSIFSTKAELSETKDSINNLAQTVTNNTIFNDSATGLNYKVKVFNGNLILKNLNVGKLLVIGNSMVKDAFVTLTSDDRAMAASVPNHGFADFIASKFGATLTKMNVFEFEHDYAVTTTAYDFATNWDIDADYDAIIFSIGANTPSTDSTSLANLLVSYGQAIEYLKSTNPQAEIYMHTPFQSGSVSNTVQSAALAHYVPFIDTSFMAEYENNSDIFKVGDYYKDASGNYHFIDDLGIARHPSDIGHLRIADTLLVAMASSAHTAIRKTITLNQTAGGVIGTPNTSWVEGGIVTIRVVADSGKTISSLSVVDVDAGAIATTQRTNTHGVFYTFVMPNKDVTVTPSWI